MAAVRILVDTDVFIAIVEELRRFRLILLTPAIAGRYATIRRSTPGL
jgi:hypothetical protein